MSKKKYKTYSKRKIHQKLSIALGVGVSVIAFWRGAWGLMDLYLFPNNPTFSYAISFIVGIAILYGTHHIVNELM